MKDVQKELLAISTTLSSLSNQVEKMIKVLEKGSGKAAPAKKVVAAKKAKAAAKKAKAPAMATRARAPNVIAPPAMNTVGMNSHSTICSPAGTHTALMVV